MDQAEVEELLRDCPTLYHMAAGGSWPAIKCRGLLSTTALLDLYGVDGAARREIEARRRSSNIPLTAKNLPRAIVRDQLPMDDGGLGRCLQDGLSPTAWYRLLNKKVFFWLTRERLHRLSNAAAYKNHEHDVLEVDSRSLVSAYRDKIWLCPMNSGCTKPFPHPRGRDTFKQMSTYPYSVWRAKRSKGERVVELAVDYGVPDIEKYVTRVRRVKAAATLRVLFSRD